MAHKIYNLQLLQIHFRSIGCWHMADLIGRMIAGQMSVESKVVTK
jgi:hypothetical protein